MLILYFYQRLLTNTEREMLNGFYFEGSMFKNVEVYINGFRADPVLYLVFKNIVFHFQKLFLFQLIKSLTDSLVDKKNLWFSLPSWRMAEVLLKHIGMLRIGTKNDLAIRQKKSPFYYQIKSPTYIVYNTFYS